MSYENNEMPPLGPPLSFNLPLNPYEGMDKVGKKKWEADDAFWRKAIEQFKKGDLDKAVETCKRITNGDTRDKAFAAIGNTLSKSGGYDRAKEIIYLIDDSQKKITLLQSLAINQNLAGFADEAKKTAVEIEKIKESANEKPVEES